MAGNWTRLLILAPDRGSAVDCAALFGKTPDEISVVIRESQLRGLMLAGRPTISLGDVGLERAALKKGAQVYRLTDEPTRNFKATR